MIGHKYALYLLLLCGSCTSEKQSNTNSAHIQSLIAHINDDYDNLHPEYTPAVEDLIRIGMPALKHGVLDLLLSDSEETRYHAEAVLSDVSSELYGFHSGRGWQDPSGQEEWKRLWGKMGYSYKASPEVRKSAYLRWQKWLQEQK